MFITWPHRESIQRQHALQQVLEQIRAQIADVLVVVHGRPAGIETDLVPGQWREFAQPALEVVV
jgi:hypothetical protein